ncbi:hypothetical protein HPB47_005639 [Ixodes persulcatus]|uniref:Uncharacterized protein n=1 Tax=Ixodes persulcatus TaxID=34615 RepID=A0AC60PCQ3_IXOPE|nr:hypothetical protein HPB47_005639 [Ixodes persulcatus]
MVRPIPENMDPERHQERRQERAHMLSKRPEPTNCIYTDAVYLHHTQEGDARHQAIKVDVGSSGSVKALFEVIEETCQQPATIVVNCAAIGAVLRPLLSTDEEHLDNVMRINLKVNLV